MNLREKIEEIVKKDRLTKIGDVLVCLSCKKEFVKKKGSQRYCDVCRFDESKKGLMKKYQYCLTEWKVNQLLSLFKQTMLEMVEGMKRKPNEGWEKKAIKSPRWEVYNQALEDIKKKIEEI